MRKLLMVLVVLVVASFAGQYDLLVGYADGSYTGVATNIGGDPFYDSVTYEDWRSSTPTVDQPPR